MTVGISWPLRAFAGREEPAQHSGPVPRGLLQWNRSSQGPGALRRRLAIIERALGALNPISADYRRLSRFYQGNSFDIELDASGRVTLPPPLLAHSGISKEVVVVGVGDHLEVWAKERWQQQQDALDAEIEEVTERLGHPS
jgi:DNA-binding transcriptional regulator/RsmH inhibitor MraZ